MTNKFSYVYNGNLHMDVLCVERNSNYIFAGIGNTLFVYRDETYETSFPIFLNERIHNLYVNDNNILIKGGKQLALVVVEKIGETVNLQWISEIQCSDWIQDVTKFNDNVIGLTTAHNLFEVWNLSSKEKVDARSCSEKCLLYSCKSIGNSSENAIIFSGTVFGEILIWNPFAIEEKNILKRIEAHSGAVFSIEVSIKERVMTSTSDDRSLKVWSIDTSGSLQQSQGWRCANVVLLHTLFGHTARVWKSLIISDFYVTIGEDSQLIIWRNNGAIHKKLSLHQESGIRGLSYSKENNEVITGGQDGGINRISWKNLMSGCKSLDEGKVIKADNNFSTRVCFVPNGFVYTTNGGCMLVNGTQEEFIYQSEDFLSYCVLEVSASGDFIILGSIKGHLVIIDTESKAVVVKGQYLNGRVYSIHWLNDNILTCGFNGVLSLWKLSKNMLSSSKTFTLPTCKERWTTCALIHNNNLVVGDRMGNIYVYNMEKGDMPIQAYHKIHSYLGVTHIIKDSKNVLTIGRDGTLKNFSESLSHLRTNKLPMDWPWKIINYKNDNLILGFHSTFLIVWSVKLREVIVTQECGGGHRSCHCVLVGDHLKFLYVKEKKAFQIIMPLVGFIRLRNGFHSKEINALKVIPADPVIMITGSEDTTLRISVMLPKDIEALHVLKTHLSSVRTLAICSLADDEFLIASAGGKAQILLWKFNVKSNDCKEMVNYRLKKEDRIWKCSTPSVDPEIRFMCCDILKNENGFLIVVGCSDCRILLFSFSETFRVLCTALYTHCILKISILKILDMTYVMTLGTDGKIVFWRFTPNNCDLKQCGSARIHQSGINSMSLETLGPGLLMIATGGDDNKIAISKAELNENEIKIYESWSNNNVHSCQITGAMIIKNYLITASIDQRVTLWKWSYNNDDINVQYEDQRLTSIPDVQGIDGVLRPDNTILAIIHGKGVETVKIEPEIGK